MIAHTQSPETKANGAVAEAYDALTRTFEEFKSTNDDRLEQIERRMGADVLTEEKLARIDRAMDEASRRADALSLKSRRPLLGGDGQDAPVNREHKAAFESYVRGGDSDGLKRLEAKSLSGGSGPDGGYLVPTNAEREILRRMSAASPIRAIASVRPVSTATFKKAFSSTGPVAGWSGETAVRSQTGAQQLSDLTFPTFELFAQPAATHARQPAREQHHRAPHRQQRADEGTEHHRVHPRQQPQPERQAQQAADQEGRQRLPLEAAPHRERRQQLAAERAEHRQHRGQGRRQHPDPEAQRGEAEAEARQALHEAGAGGADEDDGDRGGRRVRHPAARCWVRPARASRGCRP